MSFRVDLICLLFGKSYFKLSTINKSVKLIIIVIIALIIIMITIITIRIITITIIVIVIIWIRCLQ